MTKAQHKIYIYILLGIGITSVIFLVINGINYYSTPLEERFFDPSHKLLKPSGIVGHGIGILGSLMMIVGVFTYMIRKRIKKFSRWGVLKHWLEMHIFLCSIGPIFVLFHTAFKFGGIVAISFWSMVAVVLSGVIGRFIYIQIPRTIQGREIDLFELNEENINLTLKLRENLKVDEKIIQEIEEFLLSVDYSKISLKNVIFILLKEYISNRKVIRLIKRKLKKTKVSKYKRNQILKIAKSKFVLARRIGMLKLMQELFKYWHVAHLPFAIIMLVIMIIHVGVTIVFGYKWIF